MKVVQKIKKISNTKKSIDTTRIIKEIENCDIVSFDIFDTLLKRNIENPTDVFRYMEKKYNKVGFFQKRIEAEQKARIKKTSREITVTRRIIVPTYGNFTAD